MVAGKGSFLRWTSISLIAGLQLLYLPLNQTLSGGIAPALAFDAKIPVQPQWVFIYLAAIPIWVLTLVWSTSKMDNRMFRISAITALLAVLTGVLTYWLFPTYVIRPAVPGHDLASNILRWVYANDQTYNALPSSHVYLTVLICIMWSLWKPRWRWLWIGLCGLICLSTLFTKQHYILDVISGLFLGILAGWLGWLVNRWLEKSSPFITRNIQGDEKKGEIQ